jgi:Arc/MetJ-type ribon-helix-helix transcriptional regulator
LSSELSPENELVLEHVVSIGIYHDRGEALDRAVDLLRHREQLLRDVNEGIEQLESGKGVPLDIEAIKATVRSRLKTHEALINSRVATQSQASRSVSM